MNKRRLLVRVIGALTALIMLGTVMASATATTSDLDDGISPTDLAQLLAGPGVTVSNVSYTGSNVSAGTFVETDPSVIGFEEGVVLSSGWVDDVPGPNSDDATLRQ